VPEVVLSHHHEARDQCAARGHRAARGHHTANASTTHHCDQHDDAPRVRVGGPLVPHVPSENLSTFTEARPRLKPDTCACPVNQLSRSGCFLKEQGERRCTCHGRWEECPSQLCVLAHTQRNPRYRTENPVHAGLNFVCDELRVSNLGFNFSIFTYSPPPSQELNDNCSSSAPRREASWKITSKGMPDVDSVSITIRPEDPQPAELNDNCSSSVTRENSPVEMTPVHAISITTSLEELPPVVLTDNFMSPSPWSVSTRENSPVEMTPIDDISITMYPEEPPPT
ncbi:uncharacterized protein LOC111734436, partial [Pteropus vampyrus]|uniref:Uncharacterized protein LOC111734436 n=1 Tax=Pteropus vampyrus TaxID=132908 RepID=A0A6P6C4U9_PTEVA